MQAALKATQFPAAKAGSRAATGGARGRTLEGRHHMLDGIW